MTIAVPVATVTVPVATVTVPVATVTVPVATVTIPVAVVPWAPKGIVRKRRIGRQIPRSPKPNVQGDARPVPEVVVPRVVQVTWVTVVAGEIPAIAMWIGVGVGPIVVILVHHDAVPGLRLIHRDLLIVRLAVHVLVAQLRVAAASQDQECRAGQIPGRSACQGSREVCHCSTG
jgi:hypothetical protein